MNTDEILFRCHYLGELLTEPQGKSNFQKWQETKAELERRQIEYGDIANKETKLAKNKLAKIESLSIDVMELGLVKDEVHLSETCKKRLVKVFVENKYGREYDIESKYIKKGLQVEEDSITLYSRLKKRAYFKNEIALSNKWIKGMPDFGDHNEKKGETIRNAQTIIDTKSSWDLFTFWNSQVSELDNNYYWQGQGYMDLLPGAKSVRVAYCLIDTPSTIITDEQNRLKWKMGVINPDKDPDFIAACDKIQKNLTYSDIPLEERMFERVIVRDNEAIERMHKRVEQCREWMRVYLFGGALKVEAAEVL